MSGRDGGTKEAAVREEEVESFSGKHPQEVLRASLPRRQNCYHLGDVWNYVQYNRFLFLRLWKLTVSGAKTDRERERERE